MWIMQDQPQNNYTTYGCNCNIVHIHILTQRYLLKGQHCQSIQESCSMLIQRKCVSIIVIQIQKFRPVLQVCFTHVSQCHWCTGKAYSPSHRFSSPETKLWPSDSESPPTTSQATQAGREESGEKDNRRRRKGEKKRVTGMGGIKDKEKKRKNRSRTVNDQEK